MITSLVIFPDISKNFGLSNISLRKKCLYSDLLWFAVLKHSPAFELGVILVHFFPAFSCIRTEHGEILRIFSPNAGKCGKNADQNNSEYEHFLRSVYQLREHVDDLFITSCQVTSLVYISTWYNHVLKLSTRVGECTSPMWTYVIRNWCIPNGLVTCCIL